MNKFPSNARYVTNTVILQIDVQKKENENEKSEDSENKWEQVKRKKTFHKQPNLSSSQPSTSSDLHPSSPKEDNNPLASLNTFEPLDPSAPPSPGPRSRSRSRSPQHTPNPPSSPLVSNSHTPPPLVDKTLTRK